MVCPTVILSHNNLVGGASIGLEIYGGVRINHLIMLLLILGGFHMCRRRRLRGTRRCQYERRQKPCNLMWFESTSH